MPMVRESNTVTGCMTYRFYDKHRTGWKRFWAEMGGCMESTVQWAKDAGIESPEQWYNSLHLFLFNKFDGNEDLLRKAAKSKAFGDFLSQVAENHINCPKEDMWYINMGLTHGHFVADLERAIEFECPHDAVSFLDSKSPELGGCLYDEFILSLTGWVEEVRSAASELNKQAFLLEDQVYTHKFYAGQKVSHFFYPGKELEVLGVVDNKVVAKHNTGCLSVIEDVWNLV